MDDPEVCVHFKTESHGEIPIWFNKESGEDLIRAINRKLGEPFRICKNPAYKADDEIAL